MTEKKAASSSQQEEAAVPQQPAEKQQQAQAEIAAQEVNYQPDVAPFPGGRYIYKDAEGKEHLVNAFNQPIGEEGNVLDETPFPRE